METTEHVEGAALPLAAAAARLGITPDALRARLRRGKARGFKRGGRLYVYPGPGATTAGPRERGDRERSEHRPAGAAGADLEVVVGFQKVELDRLLRDNTRLNQRLDRLLGELGNLHEAQRREQVLRQQDQAQRGELQALLVRLTDRLPRAPAAAETGDAAVAPRVQVGAARPFGRERDRDAGTGPGQAKEPDAAALAEIVREVGQSLRALDEDGEPGSPASERTPR